MMPGGGGLYFGPAILAVVDLYRTFVASGNFKYDEPSDGLNIEGF